MADMWTVTRTVAVTEYVTVRASDPQWAVWAAKQEPEANWRGTGSTRYDVEAERV